MIHGVAGAYMACHLYQHKRAVSPSLSRSCVLSLFRSLCEEHKQKARRAASSPLLFFYIHFYLLSLFWIYPGRDGRFTARLIYSGESRVSPALTDLMHESVQEE
ncbi:hypothetical protein QQF64_013319 [Cirrhinus molitorella]|uniref:Uncharacterized protein n=1 Tax=Cirrhinus molitorella TaxID=172907 RepID=A0ABR3LUZ0_9TELE